MNEDNTAVFDFKRCIVLGHRRTLKTGQPSSDDLQHLSSEIYGSWKVLGRQLKLNDSQLLSIDLEELGMYEKCYRMLRKWTQAEGGRTNYETLSRALEQKLVDRRDLASKYCYLQNDAEQSLDPVQGCRPMNGGKETASYHYKLLKEHRKKLLKEKKKK